MNNCFFCQYKVEPSYKEVENLTKFLSPRKKILGRDKTGICAKHQRTLTKQVKYSRFLALMPYVSYQGLR
ncbi:30S ribosomal protein S18 [Candidatus Roizmanbacteria bacterium RIFCSPLOWO2_01_FULL_37_12]|uniref:30S ribosomal protein S18 n=1 Tax=Candidatus Roizmanbacteria bacterium RIFCSPLOWO2_01_FULL_37_12 TaxID=1802056 RepID=A0A1F7IAI1_9BACT|nr:MAG: 30S ribosomal protein S18 [Candidatus Roizmanbacteria bacterium RIFCSPHIGHO2_02_FULL_37_9b]OGK40342.1 MAG: 30S ribosomal protein S18 [Candidatus Roizmanbacteria bacterium RIFCSPLOWO2_01_FULL_37_12]